MKPRATFWIVRHDDNRVTSICKWCDEPSPRATDERAPRWQRAHVCKTESKEKP